MAGISETHTHQGAMGLAKHGNQADFVSAAIIEIKGRAGLGWCESAAWGGVTRPGYGVRFRRFGPEPTPCLLMATLRKYVDDPMASLALPIAAMASV